MFPAKEAHRGTPHRVTRRQLPGQIQNLSITHKNGVSIAVSVIFDTRAREGGGKILTESLVSDH
jgi:hypothetical protein